MYLRLLFVPTLLFLLTVTVCTQDSPVPTPVKEVSAIFPPEALATFRGKERIDLFVEMDKKGEVKDVVAFGPWVTCGKNDDIVEALQRAAIEAAKKTEFTPATKDGKSVDGYATMSYSLIGTQPAPPPIDPKDQRRGGVVNGQSLSKPTPKYPSKAKKLGIQGQVTILVLLDETGKPMTARAKSGHPLLFPSAAQAACEARWTPTLFAGSPVKVGAPITYNFSNP